MDERFPRKCRTVPMERHPLRRTFLGKGRRIPFCRGRAADTAHTDQRAAPKTVCGNCGASWELLESLPGRLSLLLAS